VVDSTGRAAAGARVEWGISGKRPGAEGDADGRVSFTIEAGADAVNFTFVVSAARCATRIVPGEPPHEGRVMDLGDVRLGAGGAVAGRVVDVAGAAVAGASIAVETPDEDGSITVEFAPVAWSGADGRFVLRGVPVGRTSLSGGGDGFQTKSAAVEVRTGEETQGVVIVLDRVDPSERVSGVVKTPDGAPVPRAVVTYRFEGGGGTGQGTTRADDQGRFDLEGGKDK